MKETAVTGLHQVLSKWPQAGFSGGVWGYKLSSLNSLNYSFLLHKRNCTWHSPCEGSWWELWEEQDGEGAPSGSPLDTQDFSFSSQFIFFFFQLKRTNLIVPRLSLRFGIIQRQRFYFQNNIWNMSSRLWKKKLLLNADAISLFRRQLLKMHQKSSQD